MDPNPFPAPGRAGARARGALLALALVIDTRVKADLVTDIGTAIWNFFVGIANGIASFFGSIFGALANTIAAIFNAPVQAVQSSFVSLENWSNQFGPFAPIFTLVITAAVILIVVFLVWIIIRISVAQAEGVGSEVEEGA